MQEPSVKLVPPIHKDYGLEVDFPAGMILAIITVINPNHSNSLPMAHLSRAWIFFKRPLNTGAPDLYYKPDSINIVCIYKQCFLVNRRHFYDFICEKKHLKRNFNITLARLAIDTYSQLNNNPPSSKYRNTAMLNAK